MSHTLPQRVHEAEHLPRLVFFRCRQCPAVNLGFDQLLEFPGVLILVAGQVLSLMQALRESVAPSAPKAAGPKPGGRRQKKVATTPMRRPRKAGSRRRPGKKSA